MHNLFGRHINFQFSELFPNETSFVTEYKASPFYQDSGNKLDDLHIKLTWAFLIARYANSTIGSIDENQFKYKVFSIMFAYGPAWQYKLSVQTKLRDDSNFSNFVKGNMAIYNKSYNPSTLPANDALDPLTTVNEQNANMSKKGELETYNQILLLLKNDVTEEYLSHFKKLFIVVVQPDYPLFYRTDEDQEELI